MPRSVLLDTSPALAELYYGAFRSERVTEHLEQIKRFLMAADVLAPDEATCEHYGKIAAELARKGTPIPQNDVWMAALSIQHGIPLATTDRHFEHVAGVTLLFW
jgi:tRNA(fMet)-specific endonuclease VapC